MREFLWCEGEVSIAQHVRRLQVAEMKLICIVFIGMAWLKRMNKTCMNGNGLHAWAYTGVWRAKFHLDLVADA
jgi:hypothetical protein